MAQNTVSLYIPSPLFEKAQQAQNDGSFKIKDVCIAALEQALNPETGESRTLANVNDAQELADDAAQIEYTLQYKDNLGAAQAMIDNVGSQGGWPVSVAPSNDGFWILFAYPKVLDEDNPPQP